MNLGKLGLLVVFVTLLGMQSCGKDDEEEKSAPCTHQNCDNPLPPATNLVGTWSVTEDDEDFTDKETVTFNANGTGVAHEDSNFALFNGNTGEIITEFTWEYQEDEDWYLISYGFIGLFYKIVEIDCDYMKLQNESSISNTEKANYILCR